jgi:hypothetical protein
MRGKQQADFQKLLLKLLLGCRLMPSVQGNVFGSCRITPKLRLVLQSDVDSKLQASLMVLCDNVSQFVQKIVLPANDFYSPAFYGCR